MYPEHSKIKNLLFVDIETVSCEKHFDDLSPIFKQLWTKKCETIKNDDNASIDTLYTERSPIYPEFGKIICIGVGYLTISATDSQHHIKIKTIEGDNEREILENFINLVNKYPQDKLVLCAHNGKEFDYPYICRRILVNKLSLPYSLSFSDKKPWEILHKDTLEMWRFGEFKNKTSLLMLSELFKIDNDFKKNPPNINNDIESIKKYCNMDVLTLIQVWLSINGFNTIPKENIKM